MIVLEDLVFNYPNGKPIFQGFNWRVQRGQAWVILGPSGCGKTTLLTLLAGLAKPVSGRVLVDGQALTRPRPQTGLILQDYGLLPWATVRQNASLGLDIRAFYGPDGTHAPVAPPTAGATPSTSSVDAWLARLALNELAGRFPQQLSGGQRQRTAIARTLALEPDLLLMDEPFSSLDAPTREDLQDLTQALWREQGFTLVLVTHLLEEAAALGEAILVLGVPPHTRAVVVPNPDAREAGFRYTSGYAQMCQQLRQALA